MYIADDFFYRQHKFLFIKNKIEFTYLITVKETTKLSHRQTQRAKKRLLKKQKLKENAKKLLKEKDNPEEQQIKLKNACYFPFIYMINAYCCFSNLILMKYFSFNQFQAKNALKFKDVPDVKKKKEKKTKSKAVALQDDYRGKDGDMEVYVDKPISKMKSKVESNKKKKRVKQKAKIHNIESDSDNNMASSDDDHKIIENDEQIEDEEDTSEDDNLLISTVKSKRTKQKFIKNNIENSEDSEEMDSNDEESVSDEQTEQDEDENNRSDDEDELLPIERANKKLKKKVQKEE